MPAKPAKKATPAARKKLRAKDPHLRAMDNIEDAFAKIKPRYAQPINNKRVGTMRRIRAMELGEDAW